MIQVLILLRLKIQGYEIVTRDRQLNGRRGGGVCIYIKCNLNFKLRDDLFNENLEFLAIEICKPRSRPFQIAA